MIFGLLPIFSSSFTSATTNFSPAANFLVTTNYSATISNGSAIHDFPNATNRLGSWIWASQTHDQQLCRFWKSFDIPAQERVTRAHLIITADNAYRVFLDGREIGRGSEWRRLTEYDLSLVLNSRSHVLAVEAFNDNAQAGLILGLRIELASGKTLAVMTDKSWRIVPNDLHNWENEKRPSPKWPHATVVGAMGDAPWWKNPLTTSGPTVMPLRLEFWQQGWFQLTSLSIFGIVLLICLRLTGKLALQSKAQELLHRERARIARDIHDDLGASLTQLVLLGEVAQNELPANSETRRQINGICEKARDVLRSAEEIIWVINSRRDTLSDFASHVCKYAQNFLNPTSIRCRLEIEPSLPTTPFDLPIRRNLFLAVKEAINNAAKYSEASELFLRIHREDQKIVVVVEDNGKGFDPLLANTERNGLTNMVQRMTEVGGFCDLTSSPGAGCRVKFVTPLVHAQTNHFSFWHRNRLILSKNKNTRSTSLPLRSVLPNLK